MMMGWCRSGDREAGGRGARSGPSLDFVKPLLTLPTHHTTHTGWLLFSLTVTDIARVRVLFGGGADAGGRPRDRRLPGGDPPPQAVLLRATATARLLLLLLLHLLPRQGLGTSGAAAAAAHARKVSPFHSPHEKRSGLSLPLALALIPFSYFACRLTVAVLAVDARGNVGAASTLGEHNVHRGRPAFPFVVWREGEGDPVVEEADDAGTDYC